VLLGTDLHAQLQCMVAKMSCKCCARWPGHKQHVVLLVNAGCRKRAVMMVHEPAQLKQAAAQVHVCAHACMHPCCSMPA
jgi:hypothetical protein